MYLDGALAATLNASTNSSDSQNPVTVDGGKPLNFGGDMFLCGRADGEPSRHFSGSISHLAIFDAALTPLGIQVRHKMHFKPLDPLLAILVS